MGKPNSKKVGKGTRPPGWFYNHYLTSKSAWIIGKPQRIYPGAMIPVVNIDEFVCLDADGVQTIVPLPPGVPLDEDIFEGILWHLHAVHSHYSNELILTMSQ